jgi:putative membrane protein
MSELERYRSREANLLLGKRLKVAVWIVTVVVLVLVGMMRRVTIPLPEGVDLGFLPAVHAVLNSLAALALIGGLVAILKGKPGLHRRFVSGALVLSGLFLLSYVTYHFTSGETLYGDLNGDGILSEEERSAVGGMRTVYVVILLSHIVLAAVSLPFILMTFVYGYTAQFAKHRRMARWVFPIWLYVTVTGPMC